MKKSIYILLFCLLAISLFDGICTASICDTKESVVFFGNGVKSTKRDAYDSIESIKKSLRSELPPNEFELLEFDIAYNDTHGLPLDLLESTLQILTGNVSRFWRIFMGLEIMPDWFGDKLILLSTALDRSALLTTDSLKKHIATYKNKIAEGKKVLLVAHSQGNLFGNGVFTLLDRDEQQSFGMVAVANVDNNVLGQSSPYTTLDSDKVIQALRAAQFGLPTRPLPPNTQNSGVPEDSLGHLFIQSYMTDGSNSAGRITGQIIAALDGLVSPYQTVEPGPITVTLTWGGSTDIDLHVYEPNDSHVFFENFDGPSGSLDRDDRSGHGPEHYYVYSCENLEQGVYHVGLDYFDGTSPEVAVVHIEAGLLFRTYEVYMQSEDYGSAHSPDLTANIWVKSGDNGGYEFEIYE